MRSAGDLDVQTIVEEAKKSSREFFKTLSKTKALRIGVGTRKTGSDKVTGFIEVLVSICFEEPKFDVSDLEDKLDFLKKLQQRGYILSSQDGCSISCEKLLQREELVEEYEEVRLLSQTLLTAAVMPSVTIKSR